MCSHTERINMPYALSLRHFQLLSMLRSEYRERGLEYFMPYGNPHSFIKIFLLILSLTEKQWR